jgi:long-chain acyl-CoA synthetase
MVEGWGMNETCAIGPNSLLPTRKFSGPSACRCPASTSPSSGDAGQALPPDEAREICIRGPDVTPGYYRRPEENSRAFRADGDLRTRDVGIMDERGYTRIVDRKKEMILVSGFNVYPNELENRISLWPGVVECAAIGVPDETHGEAIKVFVVKNDPTATEEAVASRCRRNLPGASCRSTSNSGISYPNPMSARPSAGSFVPLAGGARA